MMPINLIPLERRLARRVGRARRAWLVALGVYAGLTAAACLVVHLPVHADAPRVRADLERLAERLDLAERAVAVVEKSIGEKRTRLAAARAVGEHPDWSLLMESVARARKGEIVLENFDLTTTRVEVKAPAQSAGASTPKAGAKPKTKVVYVIKLIGYSPAPGGVFAFARGLEEMGVFEQVAVKDTRAVALGSMPTTRFEIQATIPEQSEGTR